MAIQSIISKLPDIGIKTQSAKNPVDNFGTFLGDFIGSVNQSQLNASEITKNFINGDGIEIHEVMIAGEKAKTSLELLMEIRNKTVDMYRELTRMSV